MEEVFDESVVEPIPEEISEPVAEPEIEEEAIDKEKIHKALTDLLQICELEDNEVRLRHIQKWRRLDLYFNNIINIFWDSAANDWREPDWDSIDEEDVPPRSIAIYRAHAEAIIAALSITVPNTLFFPDDADNADDLDTADTFSTIAKLIQKQIDAPLVFMKVLQILFNQGTVFAYNHNRKDFKFGYTRKQVFEDKEITQYSIECPECGTQLGSGMDAPVEDIQACPTCGREVIPDNLPVTDTIKIPKGEERIPKTGQFLDLFGPLNVKTSFYAREQSQCGYLILKFNQNVALLRDIYCRGDEPALEWIEAQAVDNSQDDNWSRYSPNYMGNEPQNTALVKAVWFRPWMFEALGKNETEVIAALKEQYPEGCYVVFINDKVAELIPEDMDSHWTISVNPLSNFIHGEPLGTNLATIQDIRAEVCELELQTMEHGIPETFYEASAIDSDEYNKTMARPGTKTPVKKNPGESIGNSFFQTKTATLSDEIEIIKKQYDLDAQFVTGSFASVYGGPAQGGSQTASEYNQSRAQALQRLGIVWRMVSTFWSQIIYKSCLEFVSSLEEDTKFPSKEQGTYQNNWIRLNALRGTIGSVEPEYADQLPVSWGQIKDTLTQLIQLQIPEINMTLFHPQNLEIIKKSIGITELYIPGNDDRTKQYREINQIVQNPMAQVMPGPEDDSMVHVAVCNAFLVSAGGQQLKNENPEAFQAIQMHKQQHEMMIMQQTMEQSNTPPGEQPNTAQLPITS